MTHGEFTGLLFGGQYEIEDQLDSNGIIGTYRAFQRSLQRPVAVQVLNPQFRRDAHWPAAFVRGAQIAAQYAHPNIVPVHDYGAHEGVDFAVARLMDGGSLANRLEEGPLPFPQVASTLSQIAAALDHIHAAGHYHGDPATVNIVYDDSGNAYIADFYLLGLLQVVDAVIMAGVPAFMAPERMGGQAPTALSDQYAVASVCYTMLTGQLPWSVPVYARQPTDLTPPQTHRPEIPGSVNDVLLRAVSRDPQERFPTIMAFTRQLMHALEDAPQQIFVSYSRQDADYVQRLKTFLESNGLQVWFDEQIEQGDQWFNEIHAAIQNSPAVIVVMSPEAEASEWVHKEILLAKRYGKAIFPLLLHGAELPILIDLQYEDVTDGEMPGPAFHRRLAQAIYGS
ncbi:MAG: TIR domain-containing protein [Chloroflexi bacterium]|nr:TIR domain-containing protein [Chloroflexota bacterium]